MEEKDKNYSRRLTRNHASQRQWSEIFKVLKEKNCQTRFLHPGGKSFNCEKQTNTFAYQHKLRRFSNISYFTGNIKGSSSNKYFGIGQELRSTYRT